MVDSPRSNSLHQPSYFRGFSGRSELGLGFKVASKYFSIIFVRSLHGLAQLKTKEMADSPHS